MATKRFKVSSGCGRQFLKATTLSIRERTKNYECKYRYVVEAKNWKTVDMPFQLEEATAKRLRSYGVTGNTSEDSIEWYQLPENRVWQVVLEALSERETKSI